MATGLWVWPLVANIKVNKIFKEMGMPDIRLEKLADLLVNYSVKVICVW